jgi:hypothetical protein
MKQIGRKRRYDWASENRGLTRYEYLDLREEVNRRMEAII